MKTFLCGLGLTLLAPALPVRAQFDPLTVFATCTGRLSALLEYQWLMQDPDSETTQLQRDEMAELLASATKPEAAIHAMDLRLQAKVAEANLLRLAKFGSDPVQAQVARHRAENLVKDCLSLLLAQARV